ncbi:hypothetical protein PCANC_23577 [Puccinia coronata f. sp. avenae]|uniref:Uncharacterized protein n=1 Tax=Puccinia coronata f. sp. avenae TaxID=200324 RepID=A0A2N5TM29_9BASI|nr:hypothetical protein PCANC_23577 [Puccinia coronata f. sp. avenae]PLW51162.1 hypothetical protein PCASD_02447 [Puccinia coronata f. sp. avenae]
MRPSDSNSGARHRVNRSLIQTQRPGRLATEFESVSDSLGGARPSLNRMAASNINSDAAIRARFSGSEKGNKEVQALPFYAIRTTRPPRLLGRLFIVIGLIWFR